MATLVLSTVGSALGGPVGGAIGALIGQSIDQQILGPGTRGPRLGDLSVQTSSYGTQVPRIYGTMRVAGSVIWSTDLIESTQTAGAKGQPDTTYSYAVSFAVALSSRPVGAIGRIWADGKLLRGEAGDFKVPVTFRFYDGSEDQAIDPLIGSIEGIATTPAYRGLALAMFENLELAEYGNRIPFLTFEVIADAATPGIGSVLRDASSGAISSTEARTIGGYAAYGKSMAAAAEPLITSFGIELFDDGEILRGGSAEAEFIGLDELGNSADGEPAPRIVREQLPARAMPAALRFGYYDPARDYQGAETRAAASEQRGAEDRRELPAVMASNEAKALVQEVLARAWAERDRLTLRLPPRHLGLEPGSKIELDLTPRRWTVAQCTIDGLVVVAQLRPATGGVAILAAEAGRVIASSDVVEGETSMVLIDASAGLGGTPDQPTVLVAASSATPGWRAKAVEARYGGQRISARTSGRKAVLGAAENALPAADPAVMDTVNTLDVTLVDADQWLVSCDDEALAEGANLALVGKELVQFGQADPSGPAGTFRLSRLLRGVRGTEAAVSGHAAGEAFVLIEADALKAIALPPWAEGYRVSVTCGEQSAELTLASRPKPAAIADPSGGTTADSEARAAIAQVLAALREQGLIAG